LVIQIAFNEKGYNNQMQKIEYVQIGVIHSPFSELADMPIQPTAAHGISGKIELYPEYTDGLLDLDGFSHIILLYHLHKSSGFNLTVIPFLDTEQRGLFATRAPRRPNTIGLSVVRLSHIVHNMIYIRDVDILDGTPLLDIKPFVTDFDQPEKVRMGWYERVRKNVKTKRSDGRFLGK
jgi:tRNA-Thr(GGU) m(6)t(6)A37 methyltransferase TsaA